MADEVEVPAATGGARGRQRYTVLAMFEDTLDAERVLVALRKSERAPEQVSVVVRNREAEGGSGDRRGAVARAVVANALDAVGDWLKGLAALIVPEQGTYLVAGPMGAALAGLAVDEEDSATPAGGALVEPGLPTVRGMHPRGLLHTLMEFGFSLDEAAYIGHRLEAGASVVSVTSDDPDQLQATRRLFADHDAVHIGQAQMGESVATEVEALLNAPLEVSSGGEVVVTDAVAPLLRLSREGGSDSASSLIGQRVLDRLGDEAGVIEDVLADAIDAAGERRLEIRYLIVGHGGLLGLGLLRRRLAVPADQVELEGALPRLRVSKEVLQRAPEYDADVPFSRREEQAVFAYFGSTPYWLR